jgi:hypothetical protein
MDGTHIGNNVTYLGVTFKKRMTWRLHIERTVAKVLRTYLRTYSLFKSERLNTNIKLTFYKDLIRSITTYACPSWEYAADAHLLKLQRQQNRVLRAIGNLDRRKPVRKMHMALNIIYMYDYIIKLCRSQAEVILNHRNRIVRGAGQGEAMHKKYKRLKHDDGQAYDRSAGYLSFKVVKLVKA